MNVLAIDPGASGGLAWERRGVAVALAMPETNGDVLDILRDLRADIVTAYIEHVVGFIPGGGAGAMFSFGEGFGYIQGCLDALGFRTIRVRPVKWQAALSLGKPADRVKINKTDSAENQKAARAANSRAKLDWKNKLKAEAQRRFPTIKVTLKTADALLILDYAIKAEA